MPPPALRQRVFVVSEHLDVSVVGGGKSCVLSGGDIIERMLGQPITDYKKLTVKVLSSKAGDCPAEFTTQLSLSILMDMQDQFSHQVASEMGTLAGDQGKKGLPVGPLPNPQPNPEGTVKSNPASDAQTRDLVAKLNQAADQTEADMKRTAIGGQ